MSTDFTDIQSQIQELHYAISRKILGQDVLIRKILLAVFAGGHILLEGVPGLGKTYTIQVLSEALSLDFKRISFTPDLLPSDLTGSEIYRPQKGEFSVRKGPIFTHLLLADEINRTPPKVQSALLEAMEEKRVTIGETTFDLPTPFLVFATENPIEQAGTYSLPEAELDRFMMKLIMTYPRCEDEINIFKQETTSPKKLFISENEEKIDILKVREFIIENVRVDEKIYLYISSILEATRYPGNAYESIAPLLEYGASTRAGLAFVKLARVQALTEGRDYVLPEDIKYLAHDVLRHRIGLSYEAIGTNIKADEIIDYILDNTLVP